MKKIAFLGLGSMGSRMALNLIRAGYDISVWNRSSERTKPLLDEGAKTANSPYEASQGADIVISMVRDDTASKNIWCDKSQGALAGMKTNAIAIECSTLSTKWLKELYKICKKRQIKLLDAPVAGSRPQADTAELIFLVGGDRTAFDKVISMLGVMGNTVHYAGDTGAGAMIKLAVNSLLGIQVAAMAELISLLESSEVDVHHAIEILKTIPVCSPAAGVASSAMLAGKFSPMFPIELVQKDFSYTVKCATENELAIPITQAATSVFQRAIEKGFGGDNITGVAQLYR